MADSAIVKRLPIFVHGQASGTKESSSGQFIWVLCIAFIQRNNSFSIVNVFHQIIDRFDVIALISQEGTLLKRQGAVGSGENFLNNGGIHHIGGGSQFVEGQP